MKTGEVWIVNFTPSVGDEISKTRPAVIVDIDNIAGLSLRVVVPFTDANKLARAWHVRIMPNNLNNLTKESFADVFQLKSTSTQRFIRKIGLLSDRDIEEIKIGIAKVLDLT